jgi:hypothetical protein
MLGGPFLGGLPSPEELKQNEAIKSQYLGVLT